MTAPPWLDILDQTIGVCAAHDRLDLVDQLRRKRGQLVDPKLRVLVIGEANQGKSQLINALVNAPVCAVGDDITTTTPTVIQHAETPSAALVKNTAAPRAIAAGSAADASNAAPSGQRVPVAIDEIPKQVARNPAGGGRGELISAEVGIPRKLLAAGLVLIDTPPIGALHAGRVADTLNALSSADLVVFASDATDELSATELELLTYAAKSCPNVVVALTKIDLSPGWRQVAERDRSLLANAGVAARLIPVSATLRLHAARTGDKSLNEESGFPTLITCLQRDVAAKPVQLASRSAAAAAGAAVAQLADSLHGQLSDEDADRTSRVVARFNAASRRLEEVRARSVRCQTMLADEITDLISDVDYDLRERTRKILREVDRVMEDAEPAKGWSQLEDWVSASLAEAAEANYAWLIDRAQWIAEKLARNFPTYPGDALPESVITFPDEVFDEVGRLPRPRLESYTIGQKVFTALRGSYGGLLMFGMVTSMAGMPLINGISVAAGAAFGGKSIADESEMRLKRRQAAAKAMVSRYVDDFFLKFGKDSKDVTRQLQRSLRDQLAAVVTKLQEQATAEANAARQAVQGHAVERDRRNREIRLTLEKLAVLHRRIQMLASTASASASPNLGITA